MTHASHLPRGGRRRALAVGLLLLGTAAWPISSEPISSEPISTDLSASQRLQAGQRIGIHRVLIRSIALDPREA